MPGLSFSFDWDPLSLIMQIIKEKTKMDGINQKSVICT